MTPEVPTGTALHFSTRQLPPARRVPALRELFDRAIQMDVDAEAGHPVEMEMRIAPALRRARMLSPLTATVARTPQRLQDAEDTVCLMVKERGRMALAQGAREGVPRDGDAVLLVYRRPAVIRFVQANYLSIRVPFSALAGVARVEDAAGRCIPRDAQALSLLRSYVASLPESMDAALARLAATHVHDLLALAIGATREGAELAGQRGVRAARLQAIQADLAQDPGLRIDEVAARHRITPRYVQMLFEEHGTTFSSFAMERRLESAWRMLASPRHERASILEVAMAAGFADLSHFNRRFKQRFHMTPSDARSGGRLQAGDGAGAPHG